MEKWCNLFKMRMAMPKVGSRPNTPNPTATTTTTITTSDDVFANDDLYELIARAAVDERDLTTWSSTREAYTRGVLRLVQKSSRSRIDALCEAYEDLRRSGFARASDTLTTELAPQAAAGLHVHRVSCGRLLSLVRSARMISEA